MKSKYVVNGGYPLHTYEDVEEVFSTYITSTQDKKLIRQAYELVLEKHKTQFRKSGEPYYHHLLEVAFILANLQCGPVTIAAGFLHDIVEDTEVTVEDIQKTFGADVAKIVDSLTKIQRLKLSKITAEEFDAEDHRKIFLGMARDIRVIIIKLADRLHNMRTVESLAPERQYALSKETMDVFIPIAHRLGLDIIKSELENICLKYLEPEKFAEVTKLLSKKAKTMQKSLDSLKKKIADILFEHNIQFDISARVKSTYSIYRKIYLKGRTFDEIYDILALRIITDTELQCYEILGLIHQTYRPVPGRFKDYIAMPKPNMYQSLHTTVIGGDGNFYEIQIRTKEMDHVAETGIAAHWAYKEGTGYNSEKEQKEIENKLHWFRDFVSMSTTNDSNSAVEFVDSLTHDIFEANVYVFTPKGKVVELPTGSTPVDFAYRIHTRVGDSTLGAIVNGAMVPLSTVLNTGDIVEIKTGKNIAGPSEGWLKFVKTAQAKSAIRKFLTKKNADSIRAEKITKGRQSCIDAFKDKNVSEEEMMKLLDTPKVLNNFEVNDVDSLFAAVAGRKPTANAIIEFLKIKKQVVLPSGEKSKLPANDACPVYCKGVGKIAISLANCCTPIPGDEIVGYISKGKGIVVHRKECPNMVDKDERLVEVLWKEDITAQNYPVDVIIEGRDRANLLIDTMHALSAAKAIVNSIHASSNQATLTATFTATLLVNSAKHLEEIFAIIRSVKDIFGISRVIH